MKLETPELLALTLKPGELFVLSEPAEVTTVLGSCISVTMFNHRTRLAAICHAMLPDLRSSAEMVTGTEYKYVVHAIPAMLRQFERAGILPQQIEVKMFGGANVISNGDTRTSQDIGRANIQMARRTLAQYQLRIRASNVGGCRGRKIVFNSLNGQVWHKHL